MRTLAALACLLLACSQDVDTGRRCGPGARSCVPSPMAGARAAGSGSAIPGAGSASGRTGGAPSIGRTEDTLRVHVEDIQRMTIEIITLACAGDCAEIEAIARGGHPPYAFEWEDGSTQPTRRVCLDADAELFVRTTDTAIEDDEFPYAAQSARADVSASVLDCTDAGVPDGKLCIANPSFEGAVTATQFEALDAPPWNGCYAGGLTYSAIADRGLWPFQNWTFPAASEGATYLALGQQLTFAGRASQLLCEPIPAGAARSFLVDLARATTTDAGESPQPVLQILGGSECAEGELLWTSPPLTLDWTTYCVTLRPEQPVSSLAFLPLSADGGLVEALVDNIVPVASCP